MGAETQCRRFVARLAIQVSRRTWNGCALPARSTPPLSEPRLTLLCPSPSVLGFFSAFRLFPSFSPCPRPRPAPILGTPRRNNQRHAEPPVLWRVRLPHAAHKENIGRPVRGGRPVDLARPGPQPFGFLAFEPRVITHDARRNATRAFVFGRVPTTQA